MQRVIWVPGLQGERALSEAFSSVVGTNEAAVKKAANDSAWRFQKMDYQSKSNTNPTLAHMERTLTAQLEEAIDDANTAPIILVASSVGFGALIGAMSRMKTDTSPIALIGFKPLADPIHAIDFQLGDKLVAALGNRTIEEIPMPIENADGTKDTFTLTSRHLFDGSATHLFTNPDDWQRVMDKNLMPSKLQHYSLIYADNDHLAIPQQIPRLSRMFNRPPAELIELKGTHTTDFTDELYNQVYEMVARFG